MTSVFKLSQYARLDCCIKIVTQIIFKRFVHRYSGAELFNLQRHKKKTNDTVPELSVYNLNE